MRLTEELSEQRRNMKRMNKHNYHRRVKEAGSTQKFCLPAGLSTDQPGITWQISRTFHYYLVLVVRLDNHQFYSVTD